MRVLGDDRVRVTDPSVPEAQVPAMTDGVERVVVRLKGVQSERRRLEVEVRRLSDRLDLDVAAFLGYFLGRHRHIARGVELSVGLVVRGDRPIVRLVAGGEGDEGEGLVSLIVLLGR